MYNYETEKPKIFTEEGINNFIKVRDEVKRILAYAGAFKMLSALKVITGDSWLMMVYIDRLVEIGEIREITDSSAAGQDRVFVEG